jgi:hypothetical protein
MRFSLALIVAVSVAPNSFAVDSPSSAEGSESLGGQLLDDLPGAAPQSDNERGATQRVPGEEREKNSLAPRSSILDPQPATIDRNLIPPDPEIRFHPLRFDDVGPQETGQPSGPMRLVRAGRGMAHAEALLRKQTTIAQASETQQQVVAQLDELIAELSKQCNCNGNNPSSKPPSPSQRSQAKLGKSGSQAGRGNTAARDSNDSLTGTANKPADKTAADVAELVKHLWGHLPEREREQMMQSFSDEFLPKYELEIEQYYQRLSEEQGREPRR